MALIIRTEQGQHDESHFDEEAADRDEFYCEKLAQEFTFEEEPVRHDTYPDSSEDEFEDNDGGERVYTHIPRGDGTLYLNQRFYNEAEFKETVTNYVLRTGYNVKQYKYDKDKIEFQCVGSKTCEWKVYASSIPRDEIWRIRLFKDKHSCVPNGQCEMFKVPIIARLFVDKIREEPNYFMHLKMEEIIKERWKISVSRPQCQDVGNKALKWIDVEYDLQFACLRDYGAEILEANRGSVMEIDTVKNDEGQDLFNRFYVCFDVLRKTWKQTCRLLIGVDGCFLKAKIKGQLLVALGRDADNGIYPIAWSVVQVEHRELAMVC